MHSVWLGGIIGTFVRIVSATAQRHVSSAQDIRGESRMDGIKGWDIAVLCGS